HGEQRLTLRLAVPRGFLRTGALSQFDDLLARALAGALPDRERALLCLNRSAREIAEGANETSARSASEGLRLAEASGDGEAEGQALLAMASHAVRESSGAAAAHDHARRAAVAYARAGHELGRLRAAVVMSHALWAAQKHEEAERI